MLISTISGISYIPINNQNITNCKRFQLLTKKELHYHPMNSETRKQLIQYFKPHNERLYQMIGKTFDWDK